MIFIKISLTLYDYCYTPIHHYHDQVDFMPRAMAALWKMSKSPFTGTGDRSSQKEQL